ncbi:MAG: hypothetical protein JNL08_15170 [Planctomycetes bacterium]|nr:hypothetical protein [Planctomycetota bacterium]
MRHRCRRPTAAAALATALLTALLPAQRPLRPKVPAPGAATSILFVGNSYTHYHDLPGCVQALGRAETPPRPITVRMLAPGGCTLELHWQATGDDAPRKVLPAMKPDFVVLQEQSRLPIDDEKRMRDFALRFCQLAQKHAAEPVLYMTWARADEPQLQDRIAAAYVAVGKAAGVRVAPVGRAWQHALAAHPDQTLHVEDGSHPDPRGTYLAACVLHATIFGSDVTKFPDRLTLADAKGGERVLLELSPEVGARLRAAAAAALGPATAPSPAKRG